MQLAGQKSVFDVSDVVSMLILLLTLKIFSLLKHARLHYSGDRTPQAGPHFPYTAAINSILGFWLRKFRRLRVSRVPNRMHCVEKSPRVTDTCESFRSCRMAVQF